MSALQFYRLILNSKIKSVYHLCCTSIITTVKCQMPLEVLLPGFLVVKISCINYFCKLATDQFSVFLQNNPDLFESQTQQTSAVQVQIDTSSLLRVHCMHNFILFACNFENIRIQFNEFSNDQLLARKNVKKTTSFSLF